MLIALFGIFVGLLIGFLIPISVNSVYSLYVSVAILAAIDSVLGAVRSDMEGKYDSIIFISGFIVNAILAAILAYVGDNLGVPLYYAAIFAFGVRLFNNLAVIRRILVYKARDKVYSSEKWRRIFRIKSLQVAEGPVDGEDDTEKCEKQDVVSSKDKD